MLEPEDCDQTQSKNAAMLARLLLAGVQFRGCNVKEASDVYQFGVM